MDQIGSQRNWSKYGETKVLNLQGGDPDEIDHKVIIFIIEN